MEIFEKLLLWMDPLERSGPEAMAVDEWLLETAALPVLRIYGWQGDWASLGYFGSIASARQAFPRAELVRRWTGGGMVDHRADWTYSIIAPHGEPVAGWRGAESYRLIHAALLDALQVEGLAARMSVGDEETGAALCFENPVGHDLLGPGGQKIAGAGQRRSRQGLLHQGSVSIICQDSDQSLARAIHLAGALSKSWEQSALDTSSADLVGRSLARYSLQKWTERR